MSETTPDKGPLEQRMTVQADGTVTCLSKDWFYQPGEKDNFYTVRTSHVQPLICGAETMPRILQALQGAEKSIDIGTWCFDPALSLKGYNPELKLLFNLFESLRPPFDASPRIGDVLLVAADRGVQIRLAIWSVGDLLYNPFHWGEFTRGLEEIFESFGDVGVKEYLALIKKYLNIGNEEIFISILIVIVLAYFLCTYGKDFAKKIGEDAYSYIKDMIVDYAKDNAIFFSNLAYRFIWYEYLKRFPNVEIRTVGQGISPDFIKGILNALFRSNENSLLEKSTVHNMIRENIRTHHQKCIIVDGKMPDAVGFVMGNNFSLADFDSFEHPEESGEKGGRFPFESPRQDISSLVSGNVLQDMMNNYDRIWRDAVTSPACKRDSATDAKFFNIRDMLVDFLVNYCNIKIFSKLLETVPSLQTLLGLGDKLEDLDPPALPKVLPQGNCQLSTTLKKQTNGESYIVEAYKRAIECCTSFVYFENQYFRYDTLAKFLVQRAKIRFDAKENQRRDPLYFFAVINDVEFFAFSTTYPMMETLGHAGQMPAEAHNKFWMLLSEVEGRTIQEVLKKGINGITEEEKSTIYKKYKQLVKMLREYPQLRLSTIPIAPRSAEEIKTAQDAFTLHEGPSLKGHIAVLLISKKIPYREICYDILEKLESENLIERALTLGTTITAFMDYMRDYQYEYEPVYVHSKTMIVDDAYIIIGSANMNKRSMEYDNEIDISTTRPGVARDTRRTLFAAYTENDEWIMNDQASWSEIYKGWKRLLDANWERHYEKKKLKGMLFYFYNPTVDSSLVTLD